MTTMLVVCSVITATQCIYLFHSFSPHYLKVALGYKAYIDLFFTIVLTGYFATTGALGALLMSAFTGLSISCLLYVGRKVHGYRIRENGKWVEYCPTINIKQLVETIKTKVITV